MKYIILMLLVVTANAQFVGWGSKWNDYLNRPAESGEVAPVPIFEYQYIAGAVKTQAGYFSTVTTADTITVYWGDDTSDKYAGTDRAYTHTYSTTDTFTVKIYADSDDESVMTQYTMTTASAVVSFDLNDLPSGLLVLNCQGNNSVTGNIDSLPSTVTYFYCTGNNSVSGDIVNLPSGVTVFVCQGDNSIGGDIVNLPSNIVYLSCMGNNIMTGNIANLPSNVKYFDARGNNTISDYTSGRSWPANMNYFILLPAAGSGLDSTEVDNILIDLSATTWTSSKTLNIAGNNAARTSASDAAKATLLGLGVAVTVNE